MQFALFIPKIIFLNAIFIISTIYAPLQANDSDNIILLEKKSVINRVGILEIRPNKLLQTIVSITPHQRTKGLSGLKSNHFKKNHGMLFFYFEDDLRQFWMPDTYFNLDIIFLDKNLKVLYIDKNVPAHPGTLEPPTIYKTKPIKCRHILEVKSNSIISKIIKKGDILKWRRTPGILKKN